MTALLSACFSCLIAAATAPAGQGAAELALVPAISGVAATPSGNVLVSPAPGTGPAVLEIGPDGALVRSWPLPVGPDVEVVDALADGSPVCVDPRSARLFVLGAGKVLRDVDLRKLEGIDARSLAPLVRAAPGGALMLPALDGAAAVSISPEGEGRVVRLSGAFPLTDFDVSDDGRIALLDSTTRRMRIHAADGTLLSEFPLAGSGSPSGAFYGLVRWSPSGELWVLELPSPDTRPASDVSASALVRFDAKGKRLGRADRHPGGPVFPAIGGFAMSDEGAWTASLDGTIRHIAKDGRLLASFDGTPAPKGMEWAEKRRLEKIADAPEGASLADVVGALAVTRGRRNGEILFGRLRTEAAVALPLVSSWVAKEQLDGVILATLLAATWPDTKEALGASFKDASPLVRASAVAVLRSPAISGFEAELIAATKDANRDVRASALLVIRLARWSDATRPAAVARLSDEDPDVALLAASVLAERLPETAASVAAVVKDPKATDAARTMAAKALMLDVPGGERLNPLDPAKRAPLRGLAQSPDARVQRIGTLALVVHGDPSAPAALEKAWPKMEVLHKRMAMAAWSPANGDAGAAVLGRIFQKEKNTDVRPAILEALARTSGGAARKRVIDLATKPGGDERDRALVIGLVARKLSDEHIVAMAGELPSVGTELRRAIMELIAARGVEAAAPKIASLATTDADRSAAFATLYRLGSREGVKPALANIAAGRASAEVEFSYLAAVGGLPEEARASFRELAMGRGTLAPFAAEALARSGDAYGLHVLVQAAKADRYGAPLRDGAIAGSLAALGKEGRTAAEPLLHDANAATRENGALALALLGGDACREVGTWGRSERARGVTVPTAFFALAACGELTAAQELYRSSYEAARGGASDPVLQTAAPETFAALLAKMLRQPDFRPKADAVLGAVAGLPRPVVQAVGQAVAADLHPDVAGPAMKHVF